MKYLQVLVEAGNDVALGDGNDEPASRVEVGEVPSAGLAISRVRRGDGGVAAESSQPVFSAHAQKRGRHEARTHLAPSGRITRISSSSTTASGMLEANGVRKVYREGSSGLEPRLCSSGRL